MAKEKFLMRVAAYLVPFKDGKVLLSRRYNTGYHDGEYSFVAGHLDGGETVVECMAREAKEEADITIAEDNLTVAHTMHRICPDIEYIDFYLAVEKWTGEPQIMEKDKCDDLSWHSLDALPENTLPYIRFVLEKIQAGEMFSEFRE